MKINNMVFIGSEPIETHSIIEKNNFGICLNIFSGYNRIKERINQYNECIFIDNGSFERFNLFLKNKISNDDYFDLNNSIKYFEQINQNYKILLENHQNKKIVITIPEIIGNQILTQQLQLKYLSFYKELEIKYNCSIIIALQFNPISKEWLKEVIEGFNFIKQYIPNNWFIGIPFGKDFNIISRNKENFDKLMCYKISIIPEYKLHLFALGTINKFKKFVVPYNSHINSFDASSLNLWSRNAHYLSYITEKILDIRDLKGKRGSVELCKKKQQILFKETNYYVQEWNDLSFLERFTINLLNFTLILNKNIEVDKTK